jgi:dethiobiotin synthetase
VSKLIFVTGTDTGVGKTVVTASLLHHLRQAGVQALAMKPFSSGDRNDARVMLQIQTGALTMEECNPFHFTAPLAPAAAARRQRRSVALRSVVARVREVQKRCEVMLVEGAGGLMVPLGERYTVLDLIVALNVDRVVIVAANRLGTINHTLLTHQAFASRIGRSVPCEVILNQACVKRDPSSRVNERTLREWLPRTPVTSLGFRGGDPVGDEAFKVDRKKMEKVLARILDSAIFAARQSGRP